MRLIADRFSRLQSTPVSCAVTDQLSHLPTPPILDLPNQQMYERLKLSLGLGLRRQIFIAVCDNLELRDRIAEQLARDLNSASEFASSTSRQNLDYPTFVTLHLNLDDPNPIAQIAQWLRDNPPPRQGSRRGKMPAFQLMGVERLTRQPAIAQRLFFTYLQGIERSLPALESSILMWMPRPWFNVLEQSAPEFWQCRTAVFEFVGDPTPTGAVTPTTETAPEVTPEATPEPEPAPTSEPEPDDSSLAPSEDHVPPDRVTAKTSKLSDDELRKILTHDLSKADAKHHPEFSDRQPLSPEPESDRPHAPSQDASPKSDPHTSSHQTQRPDQPIAPPLEPPHRPPNNTPPTLKTQSSGVAQHTSATATAQEEVTEEILAAQRRQFELLKTLDPQSLLRQIEVLRQQNAAGSVLANAYRTLGNLYRDRVEKGTATANDLVQSIQAYEQVLMYLPEQSPLWADVLNDLGNLYWMLSRRSPTVQERMPHLQQAIQLYQLALTKINLNTQITSYSMIQNNLGAAYGDLARYHDPATNLQHSVQAYQQALRYRSPEEDSVRYALTQNNLGTTYWNLAQYQKPSTYLKQAIAAYSEALRYYSPETEPMNHAMIQNNLGTAYWNLSQHERPQEWLMLALAAYRTALRYRTPDNAPAAYAATQNNLGTAYWHIANYSDDSPEARLDYLQQAIAAYGSALTVAAKLTAQNGNGNGHLATPLNFDVLATRNNLGLTHYQLATDYQISLTAGDRLSHLEAALGCHIQAWNGWEEQPDLRSATLTCISQTVKAFFNQSGIQGQNRALSKVPAQLLPQLLPKL